ARTCRSGSQDTTAGREYDPSEPRLQSASSESSADPSQSSADPLAVISPIVSHADEYHRPDRGHVDHLVVLLTEPALLLRRVDRPPPRRDPAVRRRLTRGAREQVLHTHVDARAELRQRVAEREVERAEG